MPHLTLEYTNNISAPAIGHILHQLNQVLAASGLFEEIDIKSRAIGFDTFLIGTRSEERSFIHAKLSILNGRTPQVKHDLSHRLLAALQEQCTGIASGHLQLCVEILEIDRDSYAKCTLA